MIAVPEIVYKLYLKQNDSCIKDGMIAVPKNCMKLYLELYGSCAPGLEPVLSIPQLPHTEPDQLGIARWYPGTLPVGRSDTTQYIGSRKRSTRSMIRMIKNQLSHL